MKEALKFYRSNRELVDNFHRQQNLTFTAIPVSSLATLDKTQIHKSTRGHYRNMSSRYYLAFIDGRPAYVRVSDHWGYFSTRGAWNDENYEYESVPHHWELDGAKRTKAGDYARVSQAGFVFLN